MKKERMGNIDVNVTNLSEALEYISKRLEQKTPTDIHFLNDHAYNIAQKDKQFLDILNNSNLLLNDGIGVELGAKLCGFNFQENLNGTDFIPELFNYLNKKEGKYRIYLLGAKQGIAKLAMERLQEQYKNLEFVGEHHGYFNHEISKVVINDINDKRTDILLVGFGMPIQEKWIAKNRENLNCSITLSVGAFIDFSSGTMKRAPLVYRKMRLEWFYRMVKEPKRMWKRNLIGHFAFFYYLHKNKKTKTT